MKFVIRDDDTCAFTSPDDIRSCYQHIYEDVPVSLSVTPFRVPGNDRNAPEHLKGNMDVMPLHDNVEIVAFLSEQISLGHIDVAMHGYHHWRCDGHPEFVGCDELERKAREGKAYLDDLFDIDIRTFVPPNNAISKIGLDAVTAAGMNLAVVLRLWSNSRRRVSLRSLSYCPPVAYHRILKGFKYPDVMNMGDHKEVMYYTVGPREGLKRLQEELRYCHQTDGVFVLATHYHAFDKPMQDGVSVRKAVDKLVDMAKAFDGVDFIRFNDLWD